MGERFYDICCNRTIKTNYNAGSMKYGCVSSSGFGDGSYVCYTIHNNDGEVIGIRIQFI